MPPSNRPIRVQIVAESHSSSMRFAFAAIHVDTSTGRHVDARAKSSGRIVGYAYRWLSYDLYDSGRQGARHCGYDPTDQRRYRSDRTCIDGDGPDGSDRDRSDRSSVDSHGSDWFRGSGWPDGSDGSWSAGSDGCAGCPGTDGSDGSWRAGSDGRDGWAGHSGTDRPDGSWRAGSDGRDG